MNSDDFSKFLAAAVDNMEPGRDFAFILSGKVKSNESEIERLLAKNKFNAKRLVLSYDTNKMRSAGYFSKMRGVANSAGTEFLYMAWLGRMPTENIAKARPERVGVSLFFLSAILTLSLSDCLLLPDIWGAVPYLLVCYRSYHVWCCPGRKRVVTCRNQCAAMVFDVQNNVFL